MASDYEKTLTFGEDDHYLELTKGKYGLEIELVTQKTWISMTLDESEIDILKQWLVENY